MTVAHPHAGAIIMAAEPSRRTGDTTTLWAPVAGLPLLAWTVQAFEAAAGVEAVVIVVTAGGVAETQALAQRQCWHKVRVVAAGEPRRCDAVRAGLDALPPACAWVILHDAARPLVTPALIEAGLDAARAGGAASAYEPVKETVKRVRDGVVVETPARADLALLQTPQVFRRTLLADLMKEPCPPNDDPPDEATLLLRQGIRVALFLGGHENVKVTTPDDLEVVESLLRQRVAET